MTDNATLVRDLEERGITPHDLEDTVLALMQDKNAQALADADEVEQERLTQQIAMEADALTGFGLAAQVAWMASYYNNREHLVWALSGYLNLPLAA